MRYPWIGDFDPVHGFEEDMAGIRTKLSAGQWHSRYAKAKRNSFVCQVVYIEPDALLLNEDVLAKKVHEHTQMAANIVAQKQEDVPPKAPDSEQQRQRHQPMLKILISRKRSEGGYCDNSGMLLWE